ncbi:hypothetical protein Tco_0361116 [Tanacetum coccineum]
MEAHCIALELKYQNQALKSGQHGQILNEISNKAKIKKEIDVLETMNIELEHSVAKLRKENETLKKHYKDLYDSIKITRSKTIEQTTSLLANNVDLKAQIQEKVFAISALKNDLRKLKGNSVDTKKKTQEKDRNSKTSVTYSARFQSTADGSKPKPRSTNHSTRKVIRFCTSKVDSEPQHGLNIDIPNIHECKQTLDVSACTSINVQKEQSLDLSAGTLCNVNKENLRLESLFGPLSDEYFNGENLVASKSSIVTTADASDKHQQQPDSTSSTSTLATTVTTDGNIDL